MRNKGKWLLVFLMVLCCAAFGAYVFFSAAANDRNAPVIKLTAEVLEVSVREEQQSLLLNATAWDEEEGNVTDSIIVESVSDIFDENKATVTYAAFDSAGNVGKETCTIVYHDYEGPLFTLSAPLLFREGTRFNVFDVIGAEDEIDGDLSERVKGTLVSGENEIEKIGAYEVSFRVTNSLGHTIYLKAPVEVVSNHTNITRLELSAYLIYLKKDASFNAEDYLQSADSRIHVQSNVNTKEAGVYTVDYSLNSDVTRLIVVVEE